MLSPSEHRGRVAGAALLLFLGLLASFGSVLPVFRGHLQRYFAIGDQAYGFMFSIGVLGGVATALLGGVWADRSGPGRMLRLGLIGIGLSMALVAACGRLWPLMALALGVGALFQTPFWIAVNAYLVRLFPDHTRRVLSLNMAAQGAGSILWPALAEGLLSLAAAVPAISFALVLHAPFALVALALVVGALILRPSPAAGHAAHEGPPWRWRGLLVSRNGLALILLAAVHGISDTTLFIWMPRYLGSGAFAVRPIPPGLVLSAYGVAYLVSRTAMTFLPETRGRRAFLVLPGLLGGAALIAGILSRDYLLTAAGYVFGALIWSVEFPAILGLIADVERTRFGLANALIMFAVTLGSFLMLNATGWSIDRLGEPHMWKAMLIPALGFPCLGVGAALWLVLGGRRASAG